MSVLSLDDKVKAPNIEKSKFDLSHTLTLTGKLGQLIPILCEEVVPGDNFRITAGHIIRMLPLAGPLNQRVDLFVHFFYVPNRIVWDGWEEFITGRGAGTMIMEDLASTNLGPRSLGDYFGIPYQNFGVTQLAKINLLPLRGYTAIWNDWYRNKIINTKLDIDALSYADSPLLRNYRKDYLTSAIPYPQLGNPSSISMDITYLATATSPGAANGAMGLFNTQLVDGNNQTMDVQNIDEITVDVNDLRYAYAYQDWLVRMLKSGDEYSDHLKNVFGVNSSDSRLQKVEYLGGYSSPIIINEVTQMAQQYDSGENLVGTPLGTEGAKAYTYGDSEIINCYCEEHGYIHGILSIIPKSLHYGGISKHLWKSVPLDYYFPQFAYLPEQEILKKEVFFEATSDDLTTFGYIERYAEYKHKNDRVTGDIIKTWRHLTFAESYDNTVALDETFIEASVPEDAFAVQNDIHFYGQIGFNIDAVRPMPFNVDGLNII